MNQESGSQASPENQIKREVELVEEECNNNSKELREYEHLLDNIEIEVLSLRIELSNFTAKFEDIQKFLANLEKELKIVPEE